jgi:hypothetical protein
MYSSTIPDLGTRRCWVVSFTPRSLYSRGAVPSTHGTGGCMSPEPVWTLWRREKSLVPAGNRTPAVQPVTRHYTDWAIWTPHKHKHAEIKSMGTIPNRLVPVNSVPECAHLILTCSMCRWVILWMKIMFSNSRLCVLSWKKLLGISCLSYAHVCSSKGNAAVL